MPLNHLWFAIPLVAGMTVFCAPSAHALTIELRLPATVHVGDTLALDVLVADVFEGLDPLEEVLAFGFDVSISDGGLVSFHSLAVASPFNDDSALFPDTGVAGSVFPGLPDDGTHDTIALASLRFRALHAGTLSLGIVSDTSDLNEGLIYLLAGSRNITASTDLVILPRSAVAEPVAFIMLGSGLLSLLGRKWRRCTRLVR